MLRVYKINCDNAQEYTVGQMYPFSYNEVDHIEASGEELVYIIGGTSHIPWVIESGRTPPSMKWYGDHAKFILGNLF